MQTVKRESSEECKNKSRKIAGSKVKQESSWDSKKETATNIKKESDQK